VEAPSSQELQDKKEIQRLQQELAKSQGQLAKTAELSTARLEFTFKFGCRKFGFVKAMGGIIATLVVRQSGKNELEIDAGDMEFDPKKVLNQNGQNELENLGYTRMIDKRVGSGKSFDEALHMVADNVAKRMCDKLSHGSTPRTKETEMNWYKDGQ